MSAARFLKWQCMLMLSLFVTKNPGMSSDLNMKCTNCLHSKYSIYLIYIQPIHLSITLYSLNVSVSLTFSIAKCYCLAMDTFATIKITIPVTSAKIWRWGTAVSRRCGRSGRSGAPGASAASPATAVKRRGPEPASKANIGRLRANSTNWSTTQPVSGKKMWMMKKGKVVFLHEILFLTKQFQEAILLRTDPSLQLGALPK